MVLQLDTARVEAARAGDPGALDALVAQYLPLVYTVVRRSLRHSADVDDVVQEAMLRIVRGVGSLREAHRLRAWVVAVTVNQIREHHRSASADSAPFDDWDAFPDPRGEFVEHTLIQLDVSGQRRETRQAARWLDPDHRELLALWWLEASGHLSRPELADALRADPHHVAVRVSRMKEQLDTARRVVRALSLSPRCPLLEQAGYDWRGETSSVWRKRFARHIRECPHCGSAAHGMIAPERLLAGLALLPLPAAYIGLRAADVLGATVAQQAVVQQAPLGGPGPGTAVGHGLGRSGAGIHAGGSAGIGGPHGAAVYGGPTGHWDPTAGGGNYGGPGNGSGGFGNGSGGGGGDGHGGSGGGSSSAPQNAVGHRVGSHRAGHGGGGSGSDGHGSGNGGSGNGGSGNGGSDHGSSGHGGSGHDGSGHGGSGHGSSGRDGSGHGGSRRGGSSHGGSGRGRSGHGGGAKAAGGLVGKPLGIAVAAVGIIAVAAAGVIEMQPMHQNTTIAVVDTATAIVSGSPQSPSGTIAMPTPSHSSASASSAKPATSSAPAAPASSSAAAPQTSAAPASSATTSSASAGSSSSSAAEQVLAVINQAREQAGLKPYTMDNDLIKSAGAHNARMQDGCGLSHQCPGEPALGDRETAAGVQWSAAGENIGEGGPVGDDQSSIAQMAVNLTNSMLAEKPPNDGHRQNILSSSFTEVGISVTRDSSGTVWMTQDFAN